MDKRSVHLKVTGMNMSSRMSHSFVFCQSRGFIWFVISILLTFPVQAIAKTYSVSEIADAMAAVESQFTDIRITYTDIFPSLTVDYKLLSVNRIDGTYLRKMPGPEELFDFRWMVNTSASRLPPVPLDLDQRNAHSQLFPATTQSLGGLFRADEIIAFNGKSTAVFDRMIESGGGLLATISAGRNARAFPPELFSPHDLVWCWARTIRFSKLLKPPIGNFSVQSQDELIDNYHAVKVAGTAFNGRIGMTLWVIPDHGFLPIRMEKIDTQEKGRNENRRLLKLVRLSNGLWYPRLIVSENPDFPTNARPYYTVLWSISTDALSEDLFHIEFPVGTVVEDLIESRQYRIHRRPASTQSTTKETEVDLRKFVKEAQQAK